MLELNIPQREVFDEASFEFITIKPVQLRLEHSLVSISKWESIYEKPFLDNKDKTRQETIDYIKCMTITQNVDPNVYKVISAQELEKIEQYLNKKMTATTIKAIDAPKKAGQFVTSELIYYWMVSLGIPLECQKWHINRLITLIRICEEKNKPPKKMSKSARNKYNSDLNAARRRRLGTSG